MKHRCRFRCVTIATVVVAASVLAAGCGGGDGEGEPARSQAGRSIILIAVDGLRADHLGPFGGEVATPSFDALAAESVRFDWCFGQAPDAAVSFASLLSGLYPTTAGVLRPGDRLPEEAVTLAEALAGSGLQAVAFVEGAAGADDLGLAQGFEVFSTSPTPGPEARSWIGAHAEAPFLVVLHGWSVGLEPATDAEGRTPPEGFAQRLQEVIASTRTEQPKALEEADLAYVEELYADRVRAVDRALGDFLAELEANGLAETATLVVTGTAGLDLGAHGATGPLSVYSTVTRVPLLIRSPGRPAKAFDKIVELVDVMPTLLELAGAEVPAGVQGASLLPIIDTTARPPYIAFSESPWLGGQRAVALGGLHLVTSTDGTAPGLFDLSADPVELQSIAEENPDKVEVLARHLEAWGKMVAAASLDPGLRSEEELDDATLEQLKSLGYIQ